MSSNDYLASNPDYITKLAQLQQSYDNNAAQNVFQQNQAAQDLGNQLRTLAQNYMQAKQNNENSFAARGLINSGLFAKAANDVNNNQAQAVNAAQGNYQMLLNKLAAASLANQSGLSTGTSQLASNAAQQYYNGLGKY